VARVTHTITYRGTVYGTAVVTCDECEHHPEKLGIDCIEWDAREVEWDEVVSDDVTACEGDCEIEDEATTDGH
jgi:hypothetical protein